MMLVLIGCHGDPLHAPGYREPVEVGGTITSNTTWRAAYSPFRIIDDLVVPQNVVWQVEAGAEIIVDWNKAIDIRGQARLVGSPQDRITVRSEYGVWQGFRFGGESTSELRDVDIFYAVVGIRADSTTTEIADCSFLYCDSTGFDVESAPLVSIEGCQFVNDRALNLFGPLAIRITNSDTVRIGNCTIAGFGQGIHLLDNNYQTTVQGNSISNCGIGIVSNSQDSVQVRDNEFRGNDIGMIIRQGSPYLEGNAFLKHNEDIRVEGYCAPTAHYNSFIGSSSWAWAHYSPLDADATLNWWGTTSISSIEAMIFDQQDDSLAGMVEVEPFLTSPNP